MSQIEALPVVLDRIDRKDADIHWPKSLVIQIYKGEILSNCGSINFLTASNFEPSVHKFYLGKYQGQHFFAVNQKIANGGMNLKAMAPDLSQRDIAIAMQALALINWHESHPKCSRCGADTKIIEQGWVRICDIDGSQHFPRTDPAIIVLVEDKDGRLLLGRQKVWVEGKFSNFAGFVEPGESLESAVLREVEEETGLKVENIKYLASQPWPFPASIMLAFSATVVSPELAKADGEEIIELKWFTKEELRNSNIILPDNFSVSRKMIEYWLNK